MDDFSWRVAVGRWSFVVIAESCPLVGKENDAHRVVIAQVRSSPAASRAAANGPARQTAGSAASGNSRRIASNASALIPLPYFRAR